MHWRPVFCAATLTTTFAVSAAGQGEPQPERAPGRSPSAPSEPLDPAEGGPGATPPEDGDPSFPEDPVEVPEGSEPAAPEPEQSGEAEAPPLPPRPGGDGEYAEPELPMTPAATDSLGGHFVLTPAAAYSIPFGRIGSNWDKREQVAEGWSFSVEAGLGVSRQVVIGAFGEFDLWSEGSSCDECDATGFAVGPFVRFHLVQGLRFDPWIGFGVGYESLTLDDGNTQSNLAGLQWARLAVGGDWYPSRNFGVGPYLGLSSGGYFDRPGEAGALRTHWAFSIGARLTLDVPGKLK
jgi:hypothetical protein